MVLVAVLGGSAEQLMRAEEPSLPLFAEPVALAPDVQHVAVMQQPVQNGRGDDGVAEELAPLSKPLLDVRMMLPFSYMTDTRVKKVVAASRS